MIYIEIICVGSKQFTELVDMPNIAIGRLMAFIRKSNWVIEKDLIHIILVSLLNITKSDMPK